MAPRQMNLPACSHLHSPLLVTCHLDNFRRSTIWHQQNSGKFAIRICNLDSPPRPALHLRVLALGESILRCCVESANVHTPQVKIAHDVLGDARLHRQFEHGQHAASELAAAKSQQAGQAPGSSLKMNDDLRVVSDHLAIQQALARYCRGIDRLDRAMLESAYWPDGHDDHVVFAGSAPEFIDWALEHLRSDIATWHCLGHSLIVLNGRRAAVETYFQARSRRRTADNEIISISSGRYVDEFEERSGEWRVLNRRVLLDLREEAPAPPTAGAPGRERWQGHHGPDDPSYETAALVAP